MEQLLTGGGDQVSTVAIRYTPPGNGGNWDPTEWDSLQLVSTPGKIKALRIELDWKPDWGKSYTFTLRKNFVDTLLSVTIVDIQMSGSDLVNEVTVARGDLISLECTPAGAPFIVRAWWTAVFEGDNAKESLLLVSSYFIEVAGTYYASVYDGSNFVRAAENMVYAICPTAGTIKNLCVKTNFAPGGGKSVALTLRVNGIDSALTCTLGAADTYKEDIVNTVVVAAGDVLTIKVVIAGGVPTSNGSGIGMTFVADTDGESLLMGGSFSGLAVGYNFLTRGRHDTTWIGAEAQRYDGGVSGFTLKDLYVEITLAPGGGNSHTFTVRKDGGDTLLAVTINHPNTTGNDLVNEFDPSDLGELGMRHSVGGVPAAADGFWGLVAYKLPAGPPGLENKSANMGSKMIAGKLI